MNPDDCEAPACMVEAWPKARKAHVCCECRQVIPPGDTYQRISGVWADGVPARYKTCQQCAELRRRYQAQDSDWVAPLGYLYDEMRESEVTIEQLEAMP